MTEPYAVVQCCERVEAALDDGDPGALRRRLRELSDLLAGDALTDPAFDEVREQAADLADRAAAHDRTAADTDLDEAVLSATLQRDMRALTHRTCRCYLRVAEVDPDALPDLEGRDPEAVAAAVEELAEDGDRLEAERAIWAARAAALAAERSSALDALQRVTEAVAELDQDRWSPDLDRIVEQEREAQEQYEELQELADQLKDDG
jgi:hypothetical protein